MDRSGPTVGRSRQAHLIVADCDLRAVDVTCCDLISVPLERVEHLDRVPYRTAGRSVEEVRVRLDAPTEVLAAKAHLHATPEAQV